MSAPLTLRQATVLLMAEVGSICRIPGKLDDWELRGNAKPDEGQPVTRAVRQLRRREYLATNYGNRAVLTSAGRVAMARRFPR